MKRGLPIRIAGVSKNYGKVRALDRFDLEVAGGEFVTLLGPSGSGKTTLLMILAGFVRPSSGALRFGDQEMVRLPPHRRNVGMVFQNYALFPHMNVFDNVAFALRLRKLPRAEIGTRVERALALVQLSGYETRRINELSGGQSQRVALARAIVFEPGILLMDEPLSALDKKLREHMQVEIRRLHEQLGITTVYVTHDQREALTMSDRVAVIHDGRLMQLDAPRALYDRPRNAFVAGFVGESTFIPVRAEGGAVMLNGDALRHSAPLPQGGSDLYLVLRPEKLRIAAPGHPDAALNRLTGTVRRTVFQGESFLMTVELPGGAEVLVRDLTRDKALEAQLATGAPVTLGIHPDDVLVIPGPPP